MKCRRHLSWIEDSYFTTIGKKNCYILELCCLFLKLPTSVYHSFFLKSNLITVIWYFLWLPISDKYIAKSIFWAVNRKLKISTMFTITKLLTVRGNKMHWIVQCKVHKFQDPFFFMIHRPIFFILFFCLL